MLSWEAGWNSDRQASELVCRPLQESLSNRAEQLAQVQRDLGLQWPLLQEPEYLTGQLEELRWRSVRELP